MTKREKNLLSQYCEYLFMVYKTKGEKDFSELYNSYKIRKECVESTANILGYTLNSTFVCKDEIRIIYQINYSKGSKILLNECIDISNAVCFGLDYELECLDFDKTLNEMMEAI